MADGVNPLLQTAAELKAIATGGAQSVTGTFQAGSVWNNPVPMNGGSFGTYTPIYNPYVSGFSAVEHVWDGLPAIDTSQFNNGNNNSIFNPNIGNFGSTAQQTQQTQPKKTTYNTDNYADCFNKLDDKKLAELQKAEAEIDALDKEYESLSKTGDAQAQEAAAEKLHAAKDKYAKLQQSLSKDLIPTDTYDNFKYANLTSEELKTIKSHNTNISKMKKDIEKINEKLMPLVSRLTAKRNEFLAKGGNPAEFSAPTEEKVIEKFRGEVSSIERDIDKEIKDLETYIKQAGAEAETQHYHTTIEKAQRVAKKEAAKKAGNTIADTVAKSMFVTDKNGNSKLADFSKVREAINGLDKTALGNYKKEDVIRVAEFMYQQAKKANVKNKDEFTANTNKLLSAVLKDSKFDTRVQVPSENGYVDNANKDRNIQNFSILRQIYNQIADDENAFDNAVDDIDISKPAVKKSQERLKDSIKLAEEFDKQQKAGTSSPTPTPQAPPAAGSASPIQPLAASAATKGKDDSEKGKDDDKDVRPDAPKPLTDEQKKELIKTRYAINNLLAQGDEKTAIEEIEKLSPEEFKYLFVDDLQDRDLTCLTNALKTSRGFLGTTQNTQTASYILARMSEMCKNSDNKIFVQQVTSDPDGLGIEQTDYHYSFGKTDGAEEIAASNYSDTKKNTDFIGLLIGDLDSPQFTEAYKKMAEDIKSQQA